MAIHETHLPTVFGALADPTRLAVISRLSKGPASVSELGAPFDMAGPSFLKHVRVLETAGLVTTAKSGRVRMVHLAPDGLAVAEAWVRRHRDEWTRRLDALDRFLDTENGS